MNAKLAISAGSNQQLRSRLHSCQREMTAHRLQHRPLPHPFQAGSRLAHTDLVFFLRRHPPRRHHDHRQRVAKRLADPLWPLADIQGSSIAVFALGQNLATLGLDRINSRLIKRITEAFRILFACLVEGGAQRI